MSLNIDWTYAGSVVFSGIVVVFVVLVALWLLVAVMGKGLSSLSGRGKKPDPAPKATAAPAATPPPPAAPMPIVEDGISDEVIAVISAAVAAMAGPGQLALRSVRRSREARPVWMAAGLEQNTRPF